MGLGSVAVLVIMAYVTWKGAEMLDPRYWFRGFVIVAAAMFAFCWMGLNNVHLGSGDDEDYAYEAPAEPRGDRTPHFFVQFAAYIGVSFAGLSIGLRNR